MQTVAISILLLVVSASANPTQPEASSVSGSVVSQPQGVQVVGNSPVVGSSPVEGSQAAIEQPPHHVHHQASYYAPAGLVTVVGQGEQGANKPVRSFEQYGQPESAALPPNYKPFGSWGLYIGGNPADGYYTNYYKALSNSVDKQQSGEPVKPSAGAGGQTAAFAPMLRQAGSSPYVGADYYPFAYSPSDLASAPRYAVESAVHSPVPPHVGPLSPAQAGAQFYGAPAAVDQSYGVLSYADSYATKKVGAAYAQKEVKEAPMVQQQQQQSKGYQSRMYSVYPAQSPVAPVAVAQPAGQQQVVAYPVPVGSQIVGSQAGVDGAFSPYGVHAFTRYAVKPTVVSQEPNYYYYGSHSHVQYPSYKQQVHQPVQGYPLGYYGFPLNQLHYSHGSVVPSAESVHHEGAHHEGVHHEAAQHGPVQPSQVEAASEKSESSESKPAQQ